MTIGANIPPSLRFGGAQHERGHRDPSCAHLSNSERHLPSCNGPWTREAELPAIALTPAGYYARKPGVRLFPRVLRSEFLLLRYHEFCELA